MAEIFKAIFPCLIGFVGAIFGSMVSYFTMKKSIEAEDKRRADERKFDLEQRSKQFFFDIKKVAYIEFLDSAESFLLCVTQPNFEKNKGLELLASLRSGVNKIKLVSPSYVTEKVEEIVLFCPHVISGANEAKNTFGRMHDELANVFQEDLRNHFSQ